MKAHLLLCLLLAGSLAIQAEPVPEKLLGDWSLQLDSGEPAWMSVGGKEVKLRIHVGARRTLPDCAGREWSHPL